MKNRREKKKYSKEIVKDLNECETKTVKNVPNYRQLKHQSQETYPLEMIQAANRFTDQEYLNRWVEPPCVYYARQNSIKRRQHPINDINEVNPNWSCYDSTPQFHMTRSEV